MAWPNPFRRRDQNTRTAWGYTFQLTTNHLTPEQSLPLKHSYDTLGEQCLNRLNQLEPPTGAETGKKTKRDLYKTLEKHCDHDDLLRELWSQVNTVPEWVDWDQIARGQDVFYRYGGAMLTGLAYQSLLGGMGANRVVETLARTGGFSTKVARHRLFETTQHILECTRSIESIKPGGAGFASSIRVRLLHAAVRQRILKLADVRPEYYSVHLWGVPINDLDCVATIGTFSATLIWLSLPRQGIFLRQREIEDYIALWRLVGHYTGTPTEFFKTPEAARAVMESLLLYEISPSPTSKILAGNIIRCLESQPPAYASRSFLEVNARWLNGNELCDELGLGRPSIYYWALMAGQCLFFMSICYFYRSFKILDTRKISALRRVFWIVIVEGKYGLGEETVYDFKYVPDYHVQTDLDEPSGSGLKEPGIERRNLKALLTGITVLGTASVLGLWATSRLWNRLFS